MKRRVSLFLLCIAALSFLFATNVTPKTSTECEPQTSLNQPTYHRIRYEYQNHCWRCGSSIDSRYNSRCSLCKWYICNKCGACRSTCSRCPGGSSSSNGSSKSSSGDNWWIIILVLGGFGVGGYFYLKRKK